MNPLQWNQMKANASSSNRAQSLNSHTQYGARLNPPQSLILQRDRFASTLATTETSESLRNLDANNATAMPSLLGLCGNSGFSSFTLHEVYPLIHTSEHHPLMQKSTHKVLGKTESQRCVKDI